MTARRLAILAVTAMLFALPAGALGHASLVRTTPAIGAIVKAAPDAITLTFTEDINTVGARVQVIGPDGERYEVGRPRADGPVLRQPISPDLPDGTTTVAWTVISADGHRISNAFLFSVGAESLGGATADEAVAEVAAVELERPAGSSTLTAVSRALRFAGIIVLLGLLGVVGLVWGPALRRGRSADAATAEAAEGAFQPIALWFARLAPPLLAFVAALTLPIEARANDIDLRGMLDLRQGQIAIAQIILALAAWPLAVRAVRSRAPRPLVLAAVPALLLALTPALSGHAGAQPSAWLSVLVDWVHVLAAGAWGGGLIVLACSAPAVFRATTAETRAPLLRGVVRRFTRVALVALVALVASGAIATLLLTSSLSEIVDTAWGRLVLAKIAVVVGTVLVAGIARRATASFATAVQIEALLIVAAIALTGTLTGLAPQPPTAAAGQPRASAFQLVRTVGDREAQVDIAPATVGEPSEVHIIVTNDVGQPARGVEGASIELVQDAETRLGVDLTLIDEAHWTGTVRIPAPGRWSVIVRLRVGEFAEEVLRGTLTAA